MRRIYPVLALFVILSFVLGACGAPATPQVVVQTQVVKEVQTQVVTQVQTVQVQVEKQVPATVQVVVTATPAPTAAAKQGGTLIVAHATDAKGLDPHKQTAFASFRTLELIYEPLLALDPSLQVVANLATSWQWSADGKTLTMKLRPNVKFHNGDVMSSADVKFSFERILDEKNAAAARSSFTDIASIDAPDANTVVFTLKTQNAAILSAMTNINSAILDQKVASTQDPAKVTVGTGPFKLDNWTPDQTTKLSANKDYWMPGKPALAGIEMRTIPDESSILAGLRAGSIDWAIINDPRVAIRASGGTQKLTVTRTPALAYHVLQLNSARPPFDNEKVRQAISCAIDRQEVLDTASLGEGQVTGPATSPAYQVSLDQLFCYKKDLARAKQLLQESGATNISFKIMAGQGEPPTAVAEAQSIQAQLKELGINTEIESLELGVYVDRWLKADFDATVALNGGNPDPDIMFYRYWHTGGNLSKVAAWTSPEVDKLLDQGRVSTDPAQRKTIYTDVQKQLTQAAPWVWLYVGYEYRMMQPYVKGFTPMPNGSFIYLRDTWLDK